jgi:hypothetical protein
MTFDLNNVPLDIFIQFVPTLDFYATTRAARSTSTSTSRSVFATGFRSYHDLDPQRHGHAFGRADFDLVAAHLTDRGRRSSSTR